MLRFIFLESLSSGCSMEIQLAQIIFPARDTVCQLFLLMQVEILSEVVCKK